MTLSEEQKQAVKNWISEGRKIAEVQTLLYEKFGLNMTYMDLRFLIDDLDIELKREPDTEPPADTQPPAEDINAQTEPQSGVKVEMDKVQRPDILAGGKVVFSDGTQGDWQLDQMGRFGLATDKGADYRPSEADMADFQNQLRALLGA